MSIRRLSPVLAKFLKLPPEPPAPFGEEKSLRVFRASPMFLKYRLVLWGISNAITVLVLFGFVIALAAGAVGSRDPAAGSVLALLALLLLAALLVVLAVSYLGVHLDYQMRWYKVTDRSLRIREGVFFTREMTMTFANIQNIEITQGPIQRWLGIADVRVQSAGGGGAVHGSAGSRQQPLFNMHVGHFSGVDNAQEIFELMQDRLRRYRSSGLGDTDETSEPHAAASAPPLQPPPTDSPLAAARELLAECRALKETVARSSAPMH